MLLISGAAFGQGPTLIPAALRDLDPDAVVRGREVTFTLSGQNLRGAGRVVFDDPAITGTLTAAGNPNQVRLTAQVGAAAQVGIHRVYVQTPNGATGAVTFYVGAWPQAEEKEPNDTPEAAPVVTLPATLAGRLQSAGDRDCFRFQAKAGEQLVFQVVAGPIRSRLQSVLELLDSSGKLLAEATGSDSPDAVLAYTFSAEGTYAIRVRDFENAGGGDVYYRLNAGPFLYAERVFPLGVPAGGGEVTLSGPGLGEGRTVRVGAHPVGRGAAAVVRSTPEGPLLDPVRLAVGEEPEVTETEPNDSPAAAQALQWPVTINGRVSSPKGADADCFRFHARKGAPLVLEVNARRLGSPLDSVIEVLDPSGKPVERATLRCVAETVLTLNDRDSVNPGLRLLAWNDFAVNDLVYLRGEIAQIAALPRGPDDDARFRAIRGQRLGMLETTPTGHALNTPVYKVQVYPPGTQFPPNGMPVFHLSYRNDDGGPLYGKDSRLTFTPPADGEYVARIRDVRGEGGEAYAYRLTLREPKPDFRLSLSPEHPNLPAGCRVPLDISVDRIDGFDGEISVRLDGLPAGFTATSTTVEAGENTATLLLSAAPDAKAPPAGVRLRLVGTARAGAGEITHATEPAGGRSLFTLLPHPDLTVTTNERRITLAPGSQQHVEAHITRQNGFAGRVPIELQNLPFGVRVLDVGLNGVLITESETARRFTIYCEPWVRPQKRLIYCTVRTETSPQSDLGAEPILLEITPPRTASTAPGRR